VNFDIWWANARPLFVGFLDVLTSSSQGTMEGGKRLLFSEIPVLHGLFLRKNGEEERRGGNVGGVHNRPLFIALTSSPRGKDGTVASPTS